MTGKLLFGLAALAAPLLATPALAGPLTTCEDYWPRIDTLAVDEHGDGIRSFYDGQVMLVAIDEGEPAAASQGFVLLMPDPQPEGEWGLMCFVARNFHGLDVEGASASYDPATGLTVHLTEQLWDVSESRAAGTRIRTLRVNLAEGTATLD